MLVKDAFHASYEYSSINFLICKHLKSHVGEACFNIIIHAVNIGDIPELQVFLRKIILK